MTAPVCCGFGTLRVADLEAGLFADALELMAGSDLAKCYSAQAAIEREGLRAGVDARLVEVNARYRLLDLQLQEGLAREASGSLGAYPRTVVDGDRSALFAELAKLGDERRTLELEASVIDGLTPGDIAVAFRSIAEGGVFRETDEASDRLRGAVHRLVERVELERADTGVRVSVYYDLGALVAGEVPNDPGRRVERSFTLPAFGPNAYRRGERTDPVPAHEAAGGDLPDRVWREVEGRVAHVAPTLLALGWQPREMVDLARLHCASGRHERVSSGRGSGHKATFATAARALVRSGALASVQHSLRDSPYQIGNEAAFMPFVIRPTPGEVATRIALHRAPADDASHRRAAVATLLDGITPTAAGAMHGIPGDAVRELRLRHLAGGLELFDLFDVTRASPDAAARLRAASDACLDPALSLRLRIGAMTCSGVDVASIAGYVGWTAQTVQSWKSKFDARGPSAFWARTWCARPHRIIVGPTAYRTAGRLRAVASRLQDDRRAMALAVAAWCAGEGAEAVWSISGATPVDVDVHLAVLREAGIPGLEAVLRRPRGTPTAEGDRLRLLAGSARDGGVGRRLVLLADAADGYGVHDLALRHGLSEAVVQVVMISWRDTAAVPTDERAFRLSHAQLDELAAFSITSGDEERPKPVTRWSDLLSFCQTRFGVLIDSETFRRLCIRHGIRVAWRKAGRPGTGSGDEDAA